MRIVVYVFLYLEGFVVCLQVHTDRDIECFVLVGKGIVVCILHVAACIAVPQFEVDMILHEVSVKILNDVVFSLKIDYRALFACFVNHYDRRNTSLAGYQSIVGTEVWCNMNDTRSVLGGYIVARNYAECTVGEWRNHWQQLFVLHANEVRTLVVAYDTIRNNLIAGLVFVHRSELAFGFEICINTCRSHNSTYLLSVIAVICLHTYIVYLWTDTQR